MTCSLPLLVLHTHIHSLFPFSLVAGHQGKLVFGRGAHALPVVIMVGRLHFYEGYSLNQVTFPIGLLRLLGICSLLVTNAAGGMNLGYRKGDIMILRDHINVPGLAGQTPLRGPLVSGTQLNQILRDNAGRSHGFLSPQLLRFPALNGIYSVRLSKALAGAAVKAGLDRSAIHSGVYLAVAGPSYETPSEIHMYRRLGADAVGMSSIPEILLAAQLEMEVVAFSLISNEIPEPTIPVSNAWLFEASNGHVNGTNGTNGATLKEGTQESMQGPTHLEVIEATEARVKDLVRVVRHFIAAQVN